MDTYDKYALLRDKKGYTDYRVCKLANIESSTISSWKTKRYEPKVQTLQKIAIALECSLSDFYGDSTENQENMIAIVALAEELERRFSNFVSLLGTVDIEVMREIVGISDLINEIKAECWKGET